MDGDPGLESSMFSSAQFNQVVFHNLNDSYPTDSDLLCYYSIHVGIEHSEQDRIGIFEVGWQSIDDAFYVQKAPEPADLIIFKAENLPKNEKMYQLCYITEHDMVAGASIPFFFRSPSDNEWVAVEDSDGDFVTVQSNFAFVQSTNTKLSAQNQKLKEDLEKIKNELQAAEKKNAEAEQLKLENEKLKKDCTAFENRILEQNLRSKSDELTCTLNFPCVSKFQQKSEQSEPEQFKDPAGWEPLDDSGQRGLNLRQINPFVTNKAALIKEKKKNAQLENEIKGLQAYISDLETASKKSTTITSAVAMVDNEQVDLIVHVLSDELSKLELENKSLKEALEATKSQKNHSCDVSVDIATEDTSKGIENDADRTVHISSDGWIRVGLKNDYCGEGKVEKACRKSVDSQENTKTKQDALKCVSLVRNDSLTGTDESNCDTFGESTSFSTMMNIIPLEVVSEIEKEPLNNFIDNQMIDSARNLTDKPFADNAKKNLNDDSSDLNISCNPPSKLAKIPVAFKHCAEDYLKNSSYCKEEIFWRKRSLISGFSHAITPLNVILGQTVAENTTFNIQVKTLAGFQSFSIEFTNNHSRIMLQMKASVYPEYAFIFNSLDENWGPEERHQFLLEPNSVYDLSFAVKHDNFEFKISEPLLNPARTTITYNHRMAPNEIRYIHISGDIIVNEASVHEPENACCQEMRERLGSAFSEYVDLSYRYAVAKTKLKRAFGKI